jgi:predicted site-specific integrase-resolvase
MNVLVSVLGGVNLTEWARAQGIPRQTAYRWFREGILPVQEVYGDVLAARPSFSDRSR